MTHKVYFMHPVNTYGTILEADFLELLAKVFPKSEIVNPNQPEHKEAYKRLTETTGDGMPYFTALASQCDEGVALSFRDGKLGAGIFKEAMRLAEENKKVLIVSAKCKFSVFDPKTAESLRLSVDETRARIRNADGSTRQY